MAIKGLTGRGARFPEIGKLFKGDKKEKKTNAQGQEYETFGKELDYWRFESKEPHIVAAFVEAFVKPSDGKPRAIPVYLPFSRTEENFDAWQEAYTAGGLSHRCNGEECVLWLNEDTGVYETTPRPCPTLAMTPEKAKRDGCKPVARMRVVIPALNQIGYVTVETHSKNDILHLDAALPAYESLRPEGLRGIPMLLSRVQKEISTPGSSKGKRARRAKWMIELKPHPQWAALYLDAQRQQALASVAEPLALPEWNGEEDVEEIEAEVAADDGRAEIVDAMIDIWFAKGKDQASWRTYHDRELGHKSTTELGEILLKWRATQAQTAKAAPKETVSI
jgi:Recombination directionality factor-like